MLRHMDSDFKMEEYALKLWRVAPLSTWIDFLMFFKAKDRAYEIANLCFRSCKTPIFFDLDQYLRLINCFYLNDQFNFTLDHLPRFWPYSHSAYEEFKIVTKLFRYFSYHPQKWDIVLNYRIERDITLTCLFLNFIPEDMIDGYIDKHAYVFNSSSWYVRVIKKIDNNDLKAKLTESYLKRFVFKEEFYPDKSLLKLLKIVTPGIHLPYQEYYKLLLSYLKSATFNIGLLAENVMQSAFIVFDKITRDDLYLLLPTMANHFFWTKLEDSLWAHYLENRLERERQFKTIAKWSFHPSNQNLFFKHLPKSLKLKIIGEAVDLGALTVIRR